MTQLIIFDCDGVLVDSEILSCRVDSEVLRSMGIDISEQEIIEGYSGLSYAGIIDRINEQYQKTIDLEEYESQCRRLVMERFRRELKSVAGIQDVLAKLTGKLCVCSSSRRERVLLSLELTGLLNYFTEIFTAEQVQRGKPEPDLFLLAASSLGVAPENCLVIEDSHYGIMGARRAQMNTIGFTGGSHCTSGRAEALSAAGAGEIVYDSQDLLTAILEWQETFN